MKPNEKWVKQFVETVGRNPTQAEYQQAKANNFDLSQFETTADDNEAVADSQIEQPKSEQPQTAQAPRLQPESTVNKTAQVAKKSSKPNQPRRRTWLIVLLTVIGVITVLGAILGSIAAYSGGSGDDELTQTAKAPKTKMSKVKVSTTSSESNSADAKPTQAPNVSEKIAMLLMSDGAANYSLTGDELLSSGTTEMAKADTKEIYEGLPNGAKVYSLSEQKAEKTPFVVIDGDTGYLFSAQSPAPFSYVAGNALKIDFATNWDQQFNNSDLASLASQINVDDTTDSTTSDDPFVSLANYTDEFNEDSATVSGSGPMTSQFIMEGDTYHWLSKDSNGDVKYDMTLTNMHDNGGGNYTLDAVDDNGTTYTLTMIQNGDDYTIKSSDINYYGRFDR